MVGKWRALTDATRTKALVGTIARAITQGPPDRGDYKAATAALRAINDAGYVLVFREPEPTEGAER